MILIRHIMSFDKFLIKNDSIFNFYFILYVLLYNQSIYLHLILLMLKIYVLYSLDFLTSVLSYALYSEALQYIVQDCSTVYSAGLQDIFRWKKSIFAEKLPNNILLFLFFFGWKVRSFSSDFFLLIFFNSFL